MKKTVLIPTFAAIITIMLLSCSVSAYAQNTQFFYNKAENSTTVYTSEDGKILNPKLKYEYKYNDYGTVIEKKAFRWNSFKEKWEPKYIITFDYDMLEPKVNYAEWNPRKKVFNKNIKQENNPLSNERLITERI